MLDVVVGDVKVDGFSILLGVGALVFEASSLSGHRRQGRTFFGGWMEGGGVVERKKREMGGERQLMSTDRRRRRRGGGWQLKRKEASRGGRWDGFM